MSNQRLRTGVVVAALLAAVGCSNADSDSQAEDTGRVELALVVVPTDVQCIRIVATGTRVREQSFNVMSGQMSVLSMNGLPVGSVTFTGDAFAGGCPTGPMTPSPTYVAEPVTAQINATGVTALTLNMRRNGMASISVDFENGAMCLAAGSACVPGSTTPCCSGLSCQGDPTGVTSCQPNMCVPAGGACPATAVCCAGLSCQPIGGTPTCVSNMCLPPGTPCMPGSTTTCCMGLMCVPDATGLPRCQQNTCMPAGAPCLPGSTMCCTGLACQSDPTGQSICQPPSMCVPGGALCTPTSICCAGTMCAPAPDGNLRCL
jgi:hypothetical protein